MTGWRIVERGGQRDRLGEGLFWSAREGALYWTDIRAPALNRLALDNGAVRRWAMPDLTGWVIERRQGGFIAGLRQGFAELSLEPFRVTPFLNPFPEHAGNRMNDAKADAAGAIWAGSMPVTEDAPTGALYRLDADRNVTRMDDGYVVANGPAFSLNGKTLYHTDSAQRLIYRFTLADGVPREKAVLIRFEDAWGHPDGMTVDSDDHLWVAHWGGGGVSRFSPDGRRVRFIPLPASQITNVCFAGEGLERMFVTSAAHQKPDEAEAGCLFEIDDPGATGIAPGLFAG
jgi:sugar lactone lactonase YvrE